MSVEWDQQYADVRRYRTWPSEDLIRFLSGAWGPPHLGRARAARALDLGCGAGGNLWALMRWGFTAFGIDPSPVARGLAAKVVREHLGDTVVAPVYYGHAAGIPFPAGFFDLVVDAMTLQHVVESRPKALAECHRVLAAGGRLLSIHLLEGTDYDAVYPGVPAAWLRSEVDLLAEWAEAGLSTDRHIITTRTDGAYVTRYVIAHLVRRP